MEYEKILHSLKEELMKEGLDCVIRPPSEYPQRTLLVYTGSDAQNRVQLLEIKIQSRVQSKKTEDYTSVQIDTFFPFVVKDLSMQDVAQFLHFLNLQIEIPGFCLNYTDNKVLYRHVLLSESQHIPKKIIISLVGISMFFQDVFGQVLERMAKGEISFIGVLEEIEGVLSKL
jgi:hypothetical protein